MSPVWVSRFWVLCPDLILTQLSEPGRREPPGHIPDLRWEPPAPDHRLGDRWSWMSTFGKGTIMIMTIIIIAASVDLTFGKPPYSPGACLGGGGPGPRGRSGRPGPRWRRGWRWPSWWWRGAPPPGAATATQRSRTTNLQSGDLGKYCDW